MIDGCINSCGCLAWGLWGPTGGIGVVREGAQWPLDSVLTLLSATAFAAHAHRNQRRKTQSAPDAVNSRCRP